MHWESACEPCIVGGQHVYRVFSTISQNPPCCLITHRILPNIHPCQVSRVGKQRLVLDLSCRKKDGQYYVVTDRWQRFSSLALSQQTLEKLAGSCDEFLVHGVDVEGMQLGIDDELVELLGMWSPIPVTYAGGARTLVRSSGEKMLMQCLWVALCRRGLQTRACFEGVLHG